MAVPHVAGMVALMISANPALAGEVDIIEDIIEATAIPMVAEQECDGVAGDAVPNPVYGYGRINALAAVEQALLFTAVEAPLEVEPLLVYPNPFTDHLELTLDHLTEPVVLNIFSSAGKLVFSKSFEQQSFLYESISMENLPKGMYFYLLEGENIQQTGKLVKVD